MASWDPIQGETPIDPSQLVRGLRRTIHTRARLNVEEFRSIQPVYVKYLAARPTRRQAPFTFDWVYKLHREMFREVWMFAGKRRNRMLNIGVEVYQIDLLMQQLLGDLGYWREHGTYPMVEQAARLHHRAVQIHPFENGNGRWSRLLADIWLKQNGELPIEWPQEIIADTSVIRGAYIKAVQAADGNDYTLLIALPRRFAGKK